MAIAFSNVYGAAGFGADPHTVPSVVVPAGGVLFVFTAQPAETVTTITSVKWNTTETLTAIRTLVANDGGVGAKNSAWGLHNPTATTADLVVDWSAGGGGYAATHVLVYTGVETGGGVAGMYRALTTPAGDSGSGADASVAATSGDWILSCTSNWDNGNNATLAALSHTIRRMDHNIESGAYDFATQDTNGTVGGTTSMTWTNDEFCTHIAFALIPSAGGAAFIAQEQLPILQAVNRASTY